MLYFILTQIVSFIIIVPIIIWCFDKEKSNRWRLIGLFAAYFFLEKLSHFIGFRIEAMQIGKNTWAAGYTTAILFTVVFYLIFNKNFKDFKFIRWKQENKIIRNVGMFCFGVLIVSLLFFTVDTLFFNVFWNVETTDIEDVLYTMVLPGVEEEMAYRGVMLGLLAASLKSKKLFSGKVTFHPGIWITGIFFGLMHGFRILPGWEIYWNWTDVWTSTVLSGAFFAWMTLKSKSIVTPIFIHNSIFFIVALVDNLHPTT